MDTGYGPGVRQIDADESIVARQEPSGSLDSPHSCRSSLIREGRNEYADTRAGMRCAGLADDALAASALIATDQSPARQWPASAPAMRGAFGSLPRACVRKKLSASSLSMRARGRATSALRRGLYDVRNYLYAYRPPFLQSQGARASGLGPTDLGAHDRGVLGEVSVSLVLFGP